MASRWLHLSFASLVCAGSIALSAHAQPPKSERDGGLLPPVVQVVSKQPLDDEEEIMVEMIKAMPRLKNDGKEEKKEENFKLIKVKKELTEEKPVAAAKTKQPASPPATTNTVRHTGSTTDVEEAPKPADATPHTNSRRAEPETAGAHVFHSDKALLPEEKTVLSFKLPTFSWHGGGKTAEEQADVTSSQAVPAGQELHSVDHPAHFDAHEEFAPPSLFASNVGWIDPALIGTQLRERYDVRFNNTTPDRAEYYTARNQQFFNGTNISGRGFPIPERKIDMQEAVTYGEYAFTNRFSVFFEMPVRFMNPDQNGAASGFGDLNTGFKVAYFAMPDQVQTFQLRIYIPTGTTENGLGVGHATIEPGLLLWQKLSDNWLLESEIRDWIPLNGLNYAGNTLRYSLGLSYDAYSNDTWSLKPVAELLGWSILRGKESRFIDSLPTFQSTHDAQGTIIESAFGVRGTCGDNFDWYLGYSIPLTGKFWFEDNIRLEVRWHF
jgi:hypothetical protein